MGVTDEIRSKLKSDPRSGVEIARLSGIHVVTISKFKSGKKNITTESLERLAVVLGSEIVVKPRKR